MSALPPPESPTCSLEWEGKGDLELGEPPVDFYVIGEPAPQGSKSIGRSGQMYEAGGQAWSTWREAVTSRACEWKRRHGPPAPFDEPVALSVEFALSREATTARWRWWPWKKRRGGSDLSKLIRAVEDSLTGVIWRDDSRVVRYRDVGKRYVWPDEPPHAHVRVWPIGHLERAWRPPSRYPHRVASPATPRRTPRAGTARRDRRPVARASASRRRRRPG
jgi:Endodeoxyribonuclease RusA